MIYGYAKMLNATPDYIIHGISYANLRLLAASVPDYSKTEKKGKNDDWDDSLDAADPRNSKKFDQGRV